MISNFVLNGTMFSGQLRLLPLPLQMESRSSPLAVVKNFSLDPSRDRDVLRWLDEQNNQSAAIREAIRYYLAREQGLTLADVLAEIRALPSRLAIVDAIPADAPATGDEPQEAARNLDDLLNRLDEGGID
jgi:hypothetical protein